MIDTIEGFARLDALRTGRLDFLDYLDNWLESLAPLPLEQVIEEAGGPQHVGIFCVDVINGFCHEGALASPRVEAIIEPITDLFRNAYAAGVENFVLTHDAHDAAALEFMDYPPHCIGGTEESKIVPELMELACAPLYHILPKNCLSSGIGTGLDAWLEAHPQVTHRIVVGDCTDLCTYHLAMYLKLRANAVNQMHPVILPANCVDTYDIPIEVALLEGIPAHPADLFHGMFLYSMSLNGVQTVSQFQFGVSKT